MPKLFQIVLVLYCTALSFCVQGQAMNTNSRTLFFEALQVFEQKQYQAAQSLFEAYLLTNSADTQQGIQAQYYICLTSLYLQQPDFKNKFNQFIAKYSTHPKAVKITYQAASFYFDKHTAPTYRQAYHLLETIAVDKPKTKQEFSTNYKLAYSYTMTKRSNEAIHYFKTVLKAHRLNAHLQEANYYLGIIYLYQKGNYVASAKCFHQVLSEDRLKESAYNLLAESYFLIENYENYTKGKEYWNKIHTQGLRISPELAKQAGKAAFKMKEYAEAIAFLEKAKSEFETDMILANSYLNLAKYQQAINTFLDVLEMPESDAYKQIIHQNLGMAYLEMSKYQRASSHFKLASNSQLFQDETILHKAAFYWAKSAYEAKDFYEATVAAEHYQDKYGGGKHSKEMDEILASSHQNLGDVAKALAYSKKLKTPSKNRQLADQKLIQHHAEELYAKKDYQKAIEAFEESLKFDYKDERLVSRAYFMMGVIAFKREMYAQAEIYYHKIPKESVYFTETLYYKGYIARKRGKHEQAINYFVNYISRESKIRTKKHHLDALVRLADSYAITKKYKEANNAYQDALHRGYRNPAYICYHRGMIALVKKDKMEALKQFNDIIYKYPASEYIYKALFSKCFILQDQGKRSDALAVISTLLQKNPPFKTKREAYLQRASLRSGLKIHDLAIQDYTAVLKLSSKGTLAQEAIRALNTYQNLGYTVVNLATINDHFEQLNPESKTLAQIRFEKAAAFSKANHEIPEIREQLKPFLLEKNSIYYNEANYLMGRAYQKRKDKSGMLKFYSKTSGEFREKIVLDIAQIELERKNFTIASEYYAEGGRIFGNKSQKADAFKGLIQAYEGMEEWDGLQEKLEELASLNESTAVAFVRLYNAKIYVKDKQYTKAIKALGKPQFDKKDDENAKIILLLGEVFSLQGNYEASNTILTSFKQHFYTYEKALERAKEIMDTNLESMHRKRND